MPDSPLCGDVVEEEEERAGGEDGQHGRVAVHHPGDGGDGVSRVVFAAVASFSRSVTFMALFEIYGAQKMSTRYHIQGLSCVS